MALYKSLTLDGVSLVNLPVLTGWRPNFVRNFVRASRFLERVPYNHTAAHGHWCTCTDLPYHTIHCATPNMGIKNANEVLERYMCKLPMNAIPRDGSVVIDGRG